MTKQELRQKYKALRRGLTDEQIEDYSLAIANQLLQLDIWNKSFYHVFLTIVHHKEINTEYILNILAGKDKNIVVPKSHFEDFSMTHFLLTDSTRLKNNSHGIPEPIDGIEIQSKQIEVVFIPLLAFDINGSRIGYGKGFYDRFLTQCKSGTVKIGLSFFEPETEVFEINNHDITLDYCVTPNQIFKF